MMQTATSDDHLQNQLPANKPYNTRKVSLSLAQLGIHVPRSSASTSAAKPDTNRPIKRVKRSHTRNSSTSSSPAPSPLARPPLSTDAHQLAGPLADNTPPPSPGTHQGHKIDTSGINDNIVVAVLEQLQSTGNRPHLIKELATILGNTLPVVESSANPAAIVSSRLANYLRRAWTALAPCPLAKEQVTTHPRRVYYYLTVTPRQEIPEYVEPLAAGKRIISPSISSGPDEEEAQDARAREQMSPSPEVDLSSHELDFLNADSELEAASISLGFEHLAVPKDIDTSHNHRGVSPPLESDEREFTQTASSMQQRKESEQAELQRQESEKAMKMDVDDGAAPGIVVHDSEPDAIVLAEETQERADQRNREAADALFGQAHPLLPVATFSSPMLRAEQTPLRAISPLPKRSFASFAADPTSVDGKGVDSFEVWDELQSPESVELDELDDLLGDYN